MIVLPRHHDTEAAGFDDWYLIAMRELILIIQDDSCCGQIVSSALQGAGYRLVTVGGAESAAREAASLSPDLVLLFVPLKSMDGWELCRQIRLQSDVPIAVISPLSEQVAEIQSLEMGADDYIFTPFSPMLLLARVRALLRRARLTSVNSALKLGAMVIDLSFGEVRLDGKVVKLTPTEFRLLATLARQPGKVLASRDLVYFAQGKEMTETVAQRIVKVHIRHLREKLRSSGRPGCVLTVHGLGYVLSVEKLGEPGETASHEWPGMNPMALT
jgi:DNA-binding response OmpR family regulator